MNLSKRQQQALLIFLATNHSVRDASEWVLSELDDIELTLRDNLLDEELSNQDEEDSSKDDELSDEEKIVYCVEIPADKLPIKERALLLDEEGNGETVTVELSTLDDDDNDECVLLLNVHKPAVNKKKREHVIVDEAVRLVIVNDLCEDDDLYQMTLVLDTGETLALAVKYESQLDVVLGTDTPCGEAAVITLV